MSESRVCFSTHRDQVDLAKSVSGNNLSAVDEFKIHSLAQFHCA